MLSAGTSSAGFSAARVASKIARYFCVWSGGTAAPGMAT